MAGAVYRSYTFTRARFSSVQVSPAELREALFTRSARRVKHVTSEFEDIARWYSEPQGTIG